MPPRHRRRRHGRNMDERVSLHGHDPDDVLRRLMGVDGIPGPYESHEEAEDPARDKDETPDDA